MDILNNQNTMWTEATQNYAILGEDFRGFLRKRLCDMVRFSK